MSLILEALRKLDREKQVREKGFLVVAAAQPALARGARTSWVLGGLVLGVVLTGTAFWMGRTPAAPGQPPELRPAAMAPTPETPPSSVVRQPVPEAPRAGMAVAHDPAPAPLPAREPVAATPETPRPAPASAPIASPSTTAGRLTLQAITERDGQPVALINDRMVREGDSLDGARVVRIGKDEVELETAGRRFTLKF